MNSKALWSRVQLFHLPAVVRPPSRSFGTYSPAAPLSTGCSRLALVDSNRTTSVRRAFAGEAESADMEAKQEKSTDQEKPEQPGEERAGYRDDMEVAYGEAYCSRSSDDGYGEIYGEAVKMYQRKPHLDEVQRGKLAERDESADALGGTKSGKEYDTSQGHPVAEKEIARHAKIITNQSTSAGGAAM